MFDFDEVVDRKGTNCAKWDTIEANNKPKDVLPMWVADMDFKSPKEIENALVKRIKQRRGFILHNYYSIWSRISRFPNEVICRC